MTDIQRDLADLAAAVDRDDWEACDAWANARVESPALAVAAGCVATAMERDRDRRAQSLESGDGGGLIERQRGMFRGIVRVWQIATRGGSVSELGADGDATYGLLVHEVPSIALAVSCSRPHVVAADASAATSPRAQQQLFAVLGALAYVTTDAHRVGRSFGLVPGTVNHVELLSGTARLLASRWYVERATTLVPWLEEDEVVAVRPAGGRLAIAPYVVQLEQAVERLVTRAARASEGVGLRGVSPHEIDAVLDKLELLEGWGWSAEVEPLRPTTMEIVRALREGATAETIAAVIAASPSPAR